MSPETLDEWCRLAIPQSMADGRSLSARDEMMFRATRGFELPFYRGRDFFPSMLNRVLLTFLVRGVL